MQSKMLDVFGMWPLVDRVCDFVGHTAALRRTCRTTATGPGCHNRALLVRLDAAEGAAACLADPVRHGLFSGRRAACLVLMVDRVSPVVSRNLVALAKLCPSVRTLAVPKLPKVDYAALIETAAQTIPHAEIALGCTIPCPWADLRGCDYCPGSSVTADTLLKLSPLARGRIVRLRLSDVPTVPLELPVVRAISVPQFFLTAHLSLPAVEWMAYDDDDDDGVVQLLREKYPSLRYVGSEYGPALRGAVDARLVPEYQPYVHVQNYDEAAGAVCVRLGEACPTEALRGLVGQTATAARFLFDSRDNDSHLDAPTDLRLPRVTAVRVLDENAFGRCPPDILADIVRLCPATRVIHIPSATADLHVLCGVVELRISDATTGDLSDLAQALRDATVMPLLRVLVVSTEPLCDGSRDLHEAAAGRPVPPVVHRCAWPARAGPMPLRARVGAIRGTAADCLACCRGSESACLADLVSLTVTGRDPDDESVCTELGAMLRGVRDLEVCVPYVTALGKMALLALLRAIGPALRTVSVSYDGTHDPTLVSVCRRAREACPFLVAYA